MRRMFISAVLAAALLQGVPARAAESTGKTKTDVEAKKETTAKPVNLYGFNLLLSLDSYNALNVAGEGDEWFLQYRFRVDWKFGSLYWKKNKVLKGLKAVLSFSVQNELVGTDPRFRSSSFSNPNFTGTNYDALAIQGQGGYLAESDTTATPRQIGGATRRANYSDIGIALQNTSWYEIPKAKINIDGGLKFTLPTSLESRARGLYTYLSTSLGLTRTFKLPKSTSLSIGYTFSWVHYFWKADVPYIQDNYDGFTDPNTGVSGTDLDYVATSYNTSDAVINGVWLSYTFLKKFTLFADYNHAWMAPYQPDKYCVIDLGGGLTTNVCDNTTAVRGYGDPAMYQTRTFQFFSFRFMYKPLPYLTATAGIMTEAPERKPDSSTLQQPFLVTNYNRYTMFMVSLTLSTEGMLNAILKKGKTTKKTKSLEDLYATDVRVF